MTRAVTILGATGSIGQNTIDLIARDAGAYRVVALTGAGNVAQLAADAIRLRAEVAVTADPARYADLKAALAGSGVAAVPIQAFARSVGLGPPGGRVVPLEAGLVAVPGDPMVEAAAVGGKQGGDQRGGVLVAARAG